MREPHRRGELERVRNDPTDEGWTSDDAALLAALTKADEPHGDSHISYKA